VREWVKAHPGWWTMVATVALFGGVALAVTWNQDPDRIAELEKQVADIEDNVAKAERDAEHAKRELADRLDAIDARESELRDAERAQESEAARRGGGVRSRKEGVAAAEQPLQGRKLPDGIWEAGRDFEPGVYRSSGGEGCYWAKLGSADTDDIQQNGGFAANQTLRIDSPWFETSGCGEWIKID
jgi:hypothetical protein